MSRTKRIKPLKRSGAVSQKSESTTKLPDPLSPEETYLSCPADVFDFSTTKDFGKSHDIIAQHRAVRAINTALSIRKPGYNIYVAGVPGTGKASVIRSFLEKFSKNSTSPDDWIYVYNFENAESPTAIKMATGAARVFKKKMEQFVKDLKADIPENFRSEEYENTISTYISAANEKKSRLFSDLEKMAKSMQFALKSTRVGIESVPIVDGLQLTEKDYNKLDDKTRLDIEQRRAKLEPEVLDFARKVRSIDLETREFLEKLRHEIGRAVINKSLDPLKEDNQENKAIVDYLDAVRDDMLQNLLDFVEDDDLEGEEREQRRDSREDKFRKYSVNVFVDNKNTKGAPVFFESNPTYYNMFGKVEKNVEHGMALTDFSMIKAGAIHKANGGYLVVQAVDMFKTPTIWDTFKRVLKNRQAFIEDLGEQYSLLPTSGLRPEPIPLDLKVILVGPNDIYYALNEYDEDFRKIFKVKAEFDSRMERSNENIESYVSFISTRTIVENLLPFDRSGVAAVIEYGSRLVEDQRYLSTRYSDIKDLTIESDFLARENGETIIRRRHVEQALDEKFYRLSLVEEQIHDMVRSRDFLITVDGERIGQVNGLAVIDLGDYSFGKVGRITCTVSASDDGIINIERASKLSGRIHDKGVLILSGFLNAVLARKREVGLSASICFEQSYGMIDGDSASAAEMVAILSALGNQPVRQNFAMTGSVNQFGDIQPVGGINEKIEGFLKVCKILGHGEQYNVIIPTQNVANLMLHRDAREAITSGYMRIFPVTYFWQAFELMTGVKLGVHSVLDPVAPDTALSRIAARLQELAKKPTREEIHEHRKKALLEQRNGERSKAARAQK